MKSDPDRMSFYASLYDKGLHGGAAYLDAEGFRFICQKATVEKGLRDIKIHYSDIRSVKAENRIAFPLTVIETTYGRTYRFMIFSRKKFIVCVEKEISLCNKG